MNNAPSRPGTPRVLLLTLVVTLFVVTAAWAADGYLGVRVQPVDEALAAALDLASADGVLVSEVLEDSPAQAAGLQRGDLILSIAGRDAGDPARFTRRVRRIDPGESVTLEVVRKGQKMELDVTMAEAEDLAYFGFEQDAPGRIEFHGESNFPFGEDGDIAIVAPRGLRRLAFGGGAQLGVNVHALDANLGRYFGAEEGVLVLGVREDTAAEEAGIQEGDVILSVDGDAVGTTGDLHEVLADFEPGDEVAVRLLRDKKEQTLAVELGESQVNHFVRQTRAPAHPGHPRVRVDRAPRAEHPVRIESWKDQELHEELQQLRDRIERLERELEEAEGN